MRCYGAYRRNANQEKAVGEGYYTSEPSEMRRVGWDTCSKQKK